MGNVDRFDKIPNNVDLKSDRKLQRALEKWLPKYQQWWKEMGPVEPWQSKDVYLRTAVSVHSDGWADFRYVKMPEYRWGIFLTPHDSDRRVGFGDEADRAAFQKVPGEFRNNLRRIIVTQADTEPASVEQQRQLALTAPSLYDMRNLFQVNIEEGRHLWAMVYLLHAFFGKDGREEADELLERRSGDEDKPRILTAFNQPCLDWLSFFAFTMFMDRDGKYQLAALAESGFDPLARTCRFMLTEEAHHLFVGETGIRRIVKRSAELMNADPNDDARAQGGIDLGLIQKTINYWYTYSLDLFGGEVSSNAAEFFAAGLKGRYREREVYDDHQALEGFKDIPVFENGRLTNRQVPMRNAMNEILRDAYISDCERAVNIWNKELERAGRDERLRLPHRRFHRHQGEYAEQDFNLDGEPISREEYQAKLGGWIPSQADQDYLVSIMKAVREPGKFANWIAPPNKGINGLPMDYEYVRD